MMVSTENDPRRAGTIWAMNLDWPIPIITPAVDVTFRRIGPETVPKLADVLGESAADEFLNRFKSGRRCYTGWVDNQLAAYGWVSFDEEFIGELSLRVRLLPGEAYIWDCATLPIFRQQHLYTALLVYILRELYAEQFCRAWIGANVENIPSQRGIASAGFKPVADMVVARVLAMRLVWIQGRPDIPENIVAEARRAFLNNRDKVWLSALVAASQR